MTSEAWGYMDENEQKEFVRAWRSWRERAWRVSQFAKGLSGIERRMLFTIIAYTQVGESAEADALVSTIGAAKIARLLSIHPSSAGRVRQQLRRKEILIYSHFTGGRKMPATDTISLTWVKEVEAEIEARPDPKPKKKHPHNSVGVSPDKHPRSSVGVSGAPAMQNTRNSIQKHPQFDLETPANRDRNTRKEMRDPLKTNLISSLSSRQQPAAPAAEQQPVAATTAAPQGSEIEKLADQVVALFDKTTGATVEHCAEVAIWLSFADAEFILHWMTRWRQETKYPSPAPDLKDYRWRLRATARRIRKGAHDKTPEQREHEARWRTNRVLALVERHWKPTGPGEIEQIRQAFREGIRGDALEWAIWKSPLPINLRAAIEQARARQAAYKPTRSERPAAGEVIH